MSNNVNPFFQLSSFGWPRDWERLPDVFIKFPFTFEFTSQDLELFRCEHAHTSLGFRWLYISDRVMYIHRGMRCVFKLLLNPEKQEHTAVYFFYEDVDLLKKEMEEPRETLLRLLNRWANEFRHFAQSAAMNCNQHKLIDIHAHILHEIDDGSMDIDMSLEMLLQLRNQGVTAVCCSSHTWGDMNSYRTNLKQLRIKATECGIDIPLYSGCEILCSKKRLTYILDALNHHQYPTLAESPFVLLEFPPYTSAREIVECARSVEELTSCAAIIAHAERYNCLSYDAEAYFEIMRRKIPVQINAYSLVAEQNPSIKSLARKLLQDGIVTFIGSDAHRTTHRSPNVASGINYIYETCTSEYADAICFGNAEKYLIKRYLY